MIFNAIVQLIISILLISTGLAINNSENSYYFKIGLLEYEPGDWNSDQTALTELIKFVKQNLDIPIMPIKRDTELRMKIGIWENPLLKN